MSLIEAIVEGTLKVDGTLELDQKPNLPPGRVAVVTKLARCTDIPAGVFPLSKP